MLILRYSPGASCTTLINKHASCGFSLFTNYRYDSIKSEQYFYWRGDYMRKFSNIMSNMSFKSIMTQKLIPLTMQEFQ